MTVASEAYHDWSGEGAGARLRVNFTPKLLLSQNFCNWPLMRFISFASNIGPAAAVPAGPAPAHSWFSRAYECRLCMDLATWSELYTVRDLYCLWAACLRSCHACVNLSRLRSSGFTPTLRSGSIALHWRDSGLGISHARNYTWGRSVFMKYLNALI